MEEDEDITIILLRRDVSSLTEKEIWCLRKAFPKKSILFRRTDPADYLEHDRMCQELQPAAVLLPLERPIPSLAMEHGFPHIIVGPEEVMELEPLIPVFKHFELHT